MIRYEAKVYNNKFFIRAACSLIRGLIEFVEVKKQMVNLMGFNLVLDKTGVNRVGKAQKPFPARKKET